MIVKRMIKYTLDNKTSYKQVNWRISGEENSFTININQNKVQHIWTKDYLKIINHTNRTQIFVSNNGESYIQLNLNQKTLVLKIKILKIKINDGIELKYEYENQKFYLKFEIIRS